MFFKIAILLSLPTLYSVAQTDTVTCCRFYTYNDESVFKKTSDTTVGINFYINHIPNDSMQLKVSHILSMKKGIYNFNVNPVKENEINITLSVSPLFDAHYLKIILERQLKVNSVQLNDQQISWEEFEKMFLKISN